MTSKIVGRWRMLPDADGTPKSSNTLTIVFREDGTSTVYPVYFDGSEQELRSRYRIEGNKIITEKQYDWQHTEDEFMIDDDGILTIEHEGLKSKWIKTNEA